MPMEAIGILNMLNIILNFSLTRCTLDYVNSVEISEGDTSKLWFSFNKETFDDFKSNINDEMLNKDCITKVPFGYHTSLGNFLSTFCMFYQNSKLINDKKFKETFEKFYNSCDEEEDEASKKASFEEFLNLQDQKMNEIIIGKYTCNDTLKAVIKKDRVILEMTNKIKINLSEINTDEASNSQDTLEASKINFIIKFDEMFIQGILGKGYLNSLTGFYDEYVIKGFDPIKTSLYDPLYELFELCSKIDHLIRESKGNDFIETEEQSRKECLHEILESFETYTSSLFKQRLSSGSFIYLGKLMEKVTARAMYYFDENNDIFSSYSKEYAESVNVLKTFLKQYFKEMNLSKESIEGLVMLCFELNV